MVREEQSSGRNPFFAKPIELVDCQGSRTFVGQDQINRNNSIIAGFEVFFQDVDGNFQGGLLQLQVLDLLQNRTRPTAADLLQRHAESRA